jgi:hypothetical protein
VPKLVLGWLLHPEDKAQLLREHPPAYPRVVAHHVTLGVGAKPGTPLPLEIEGMVVGVADDGAGVQALVAEISGTTRRPDGSVYHITWLLADRRRPVESIDVLRRGWTPLPDLRRIRLEPKAFR